MAWAKFKKTCGSNTPGIAFLAIALTSAVTVVTITAGEVSAITGSTAFKQITGDQDGVMFTDKRSKGKNAVWTKEISALLGKPNTVQCTFITELETLIACGGMAIVGDGNGEFWLCGYSANEGFNRFFDEMEVNVDPGKYGEQGKNTTEIKMTMMNGYRALPLDATQKAAIIAKTAAYCDFN